MLGRTHPGVWSGLTFVFLAVSLASCARLDDRGFEDYVGPVPAGTSRPAGPTIPPPATRPAEEVGPLKLRVQQAILLALANNPALAVERLSPAIQHTHEQQERAAFDPVVGGEISVDRVRSARPSGSFRSEESVSEDFSGAASAGLFLPTGADVRVEASTAVTDSTLYSDTFANSRVGMTVTQALLRGAGLGVNLARLRQARLDTRTSEYELRGFAEALVAEVETTYWNYALARRQIEIYSESLRLAEQQMKETQERIRVGTVAETELAASEAEVALRKESLINARSDLDRVRLRLLQLTNPQTKAGWRREILLRDRPGVPEGELDPVESHIHVARLMRPDLNQARLAVQRGDLEIVRTRNGLLPKLDLFVTLGMTGYADSFARSVADRDTQGYDLLVGLRAEYPPANRDARAQHQRAVLSRRQALEAVENLSQLVEVDVRSAFIEINRAREQIAATAATRKLQEEKLRVETEKFRVGKNTSLLVAQAQRDLVSSQIAEVRAVGYYLKSLVALYRLEGSLLERRGIAAPGRSAVDLAAGSRFGQTTD
jgi:outer membrane protein